MNFNPTLGIKTIFINNGFYSKRVTLDEAEKLIQTGEWVKGRLAFTHRGPMPQLKGRVWVNKNNEEKFIPGDELNTYLEKGWVKGRKESSKRYRR